MILGIDIGGTKTLLGLFDDQGQLRDSYKFPTPQDYQQFLETFKTAPQQFRQNLSAITVAAPGRLDHQQDIVVAFGNLPWHDVSLRKDIENLFGTATKVENDAKLAALSEARLLNSPNKTVLYLTVSTGIGGGVVRNNQLDPAMADSEPGSMLLYHDGQLAKWESFASGKAIVAKYGKKASEIDDPAIWQTISQDIAAGVVELCAVIDPDIIIFGGGVGTHFAKYGQFLIDDVYKALPPLLKKPEIRGAQRAEEAVIYGCYELTRPA